MRSKVTSKKLTIFLLASIVILRPRDLNTLLTSCLIFSISLGVALHTAMPSTSQVDPISMKPGIIFVIIYIYLFIKNWTRYIGFLAFRLAEQS